MKPVLAQFYFGTERDRDGHRISTEKFSHGLSDLDRAMELIKREAAKMFGGYTIQTPVMGGWINKANQLVDEESAVLTVIVPKANAKDEGWSSTVAINSMAQVIKLAMRQEEVLIVAQEVSSWSV